jgi:hypothetical protein
LKTREMVECLRFQCFSFSNSFVLSSWTPCSSTVHPFTQFVCVLVSTLYHAVRTYVEYKRVSSQQVRTGMKYERIVILLTVNVRNSM